jgi:hypothetical protein
MRVHRGIACLRCLEKTELSRGPDAVQRIVAWFYKSPEDVGYDDTTDQVALVRREVPEGSTEGPATRIPESAAAATQPRRSCFWLRLWGSGGGYRKGVGARVIGLDTHPPPLNGALHGSTAPHKFEVIICQDAIEHVDDPSTALRPGGRVLMMFGLRRAYALPLPDTPAAIMVFGKDRDGCGGAVQTGRRKTLRGSGIRTLSLTKFERTPHSSPQGN